MDSLFQPKDDGRGDADRHESVAAPIVSGMDTSPFVEPAEHVLNLVSLAVERGIVRDRHLSVRL
jgi:hypothetical protein